MGHESFKIREHEKIILVDLPKDFRQSELYEELKTTLLEVAGKNKDIGVNMKETDHINSGIVNVFMSAAKKIMPLGRNLYIVSPSENVKEVLYFTNVYRVLQVVEDEKELLT